MNPALQKLRYDPVTDFEPIGLVGYSPTLMVAYPAAPVKDVKDLVAQLKAKPDKYTYASAGNGTAPHFAGELFKLNSGTVMLACALQGRGARHQRHHRRPDAVHVPEPVHGAPQVKNGKLRAMAVAGPKRSPTMPDVPTLKEAGRRRRRARSGTRCFAPTKTPKPIIDQLNKALKQVLNDPEIVKRIEDRRCRRARPARRRAGRAGEERAGQVEGRRATRQADRRLKTPGASDMDTSLDDLQAWIGRSETVRDQIGATPVKALNATLDHPAMPVEPGTPLPPLWHWLYFLPLHRQSEIGPDGHAKRGGFLPPVPLPRRMWAGSQFEFRSPVRVGDEVERTSTIADVSIKEGRTGKLVFVKVQHELRCNGSSEPAIVEFHDIVYREAKRPDDVEPPPQVLRCSARPGSARSCPTTCCCSATRRSPSTATASTTTAST